MRHFDLNAILAEAHQVFPVAQHRPVIGITGNYGELTCKLGEGYYKQIVAAGGVPMIIPPVADKTVLADTLDRIDALMLSGGADINPLYCGEEPVPGLGGINCERDLPELLMARMAYNRQLPILGICRGIQTLAVALGGKVEQDIKLTTVKHSQDADRSEPTHSVSIEKDSTLYKIYSGSHFFTLHSSLFPLYVNSFHHQAVSDAGPRFRVVGRAADGVIEAIESTEFKPILGVQWHPECMGADGLPVFQWLVDEARKFKEVKRVHHHTLTLDTHCDTPMFFPQDVNFAARDPRILVDLHKMTEGRQDATIMVAYLPQNSDQWQGMKGEKRAFADDIFDKIEQIVARNADYLSLARTPQQLWDNKHAGRKSIMMGIENGLALDGDIRNIQHFKDRGIVYITLCHNGDNAARALCDHPRNLTDDQMRALAAKGGVCQITLYHGFLKKEGEATILDAMQHLDHAIQVMGIDHVGLGTDFDGDGGIRGLANSSELTNFTRQLLARRYSDADIQKIWGGNFLRVMQQVQCNNG